MKHTRGPWTVLESNNSNLIHIESRHENHYGELVATANKGKKEQRLANAQLISASPDLLYACKELLSLWEEFESFSTPEARFASALDKLQPLILSFNNKGWSWKKHGVSSSQIFRSKKEMVNGSEELWEYAKKLIQESIDAGFLVEG